MVPIAVRRLSSPLKSTFRSVGSAHPFGAKMQRQKATIVAGRRRHSVIFGRLAAWLGFAGAVCSQAAILAVAYFLAGPASLGASRNAAIAGAAALFGCVAAIVARRIGKRVQTSAVNLGRVPLRLVVDARHEVEGQHDRPPTLSGRTAVH
jgi:hypothetical protein